MRSIVPNGPTKVASSFGLNRQRGHAVRQITKRDFFLGPVKAIGLLWESLWGWLGPLWVMLGRC